MLAVCAYQFISKLQDQSNGPGGKGTVFKYKMPGDCSDDLIAESLNATDSSIRPPYQSMG